jgi:hypothetical protein
VATSARKENRWKKSVYAANDAISDRMREVEAAFMVRGPRPVAAPPIPNHTRSQVRAWMRSNSEGFDTATAIAEAANAALRLPAEAMDDDGHWVWEEALDAIDQVRLPPTVNR